VLTWYRRQALALVTAAVDRWSPVVGRVPAGIGIGDQKSRWGSCSAADSLRFNWRLAMVDQSLVDYVVVHELCHMLQRNHSRAFWAEVERVLPDTNLLKTRLKAAGRLMPL
jgi:predicted metal-dependent hydrolase